MIMTYCGSLKGFCPTRRGCDMAEMVECTKCKKPIPEYDNNITVGGKVVGHLCYKCEKSIFGGED